tara:strand:+ start:737 stop:1087 length:351 start_codon:yes stop_codon:yes gene_type:complete
MLPASEDYEITPRALNSLLKGEGSPPIRLIDCREEEEFALCRIEGAELFPLSRFAELSPGILNLDDTRPIIVYCHHGMRSMHATLFLREKGRAQVWSLAGGIDLWSSEVDTAVPRY